MADDLPEVSNMFHILTPSLYTDWASTVAACRILSTEGDSSKSARPPPQNRSGLMPVLKQDYVSMASQIDEAYEARRCASSCHIYEQLSSYIFLRT